MSLSVVAFTEEDLEELRRANKAMEGAITQIKQMKEALRFITELSTECLSNGDAPVGTGAEIAFRHICRKAREALGS